MDINDPRIVTALQWWHEAERADFERHYKNLIYDEYAPKTAKPGKRWLKLNRGTSGVYLVDVTAETLDVYSIKGYGVPNRRLAPLSDMVQMWIDRTAKVAV